MYCNVVDAVRTLVMLLGLTGNVDVPGGVAFLPFAKQSLLNTMPQQARIWYDQFSNLPRSAVSRYQGVDPAQRGLSAAGYHRPPQQSRSDPSQSEPYPEGLRETGICDGGRHLYDFYGGGGRSGATGDLCDGALRLQGILLLYRGFIAMGRPVAEPPGEARDVFADGVRAGSAHGLGSEYPFSDSRSWVEHMLKPSGVTLEKLEQEQIVYATEEPVYQKYKKSGFLTPTGKLEFYSQIPKRRLHADADL